VAIVTGKSLHAKAGTAVEYQGIISTILTLNPQKGSHPFFFAFSAVTTI
jgi:hypothetical protein